MSTIGPLPTDETDGKLSNELDAIFKEAARQLGVYRLEGDVSGPKYVAWLDIYTRLALHALDKFYGWKK